jgi:hypothetical protein
MRFYQIENTKNIGIKLSDLSKKEGVIGTAVAPQQN